MDIRAIDLNLLPVLDALLRQRSVTLAARELDMSQSALSAALARLRALTGDELFVRTGRGLRPTLRALALVQPVAEIMERVQGGILQSVRFDPAVSTREFRVAHSDVGAYVMWPRIVRAVRGQAPGVRLALRVLEQEHIAAGLADGQVDVAVGSYPKLPASLFQQRLFERDFVALVRKGHPLATKKSLTLRGFAQNPQVVVRLSSGVQEHIDALLAAKSLQREDVLTLPSYLMIPPLLMSGDFLAVLPAQLAEAFSRNGQFATLALPFPVPRTTIRMHWDRRSNEDPGSLWLRGLIVREFGNR